MIPSGSEWRHPYTLSNLDFVTQSFTLMAGKRSSPFAAICFNRCTPVVVSSLTPRTHLLILVHFFGSFLMDSRIKASTHLNSAFVVEAGSGKDPSFSYCVSYFRPSWMSIVASPPSSTIMSGPSRPGQGSICSVHHQYSSRVSPFHANTDAVPAFAIAAAWSCVEKMLQLAQRTFAPSAASVSISTPVWIVMWSEPEMQTPLNGCCGPNSARLDISPGISTSASSSSLRPNSAIPISFTFESVIAMVVEKEVSTPCAL